MILVDTSVWINHLRLNDSTLVNLLNTGQVLIHPFIIGELALGNLRQRDTILDMLNNLPCAKIAADEEVFTFINLNKLYGQGIGYIDAHLLASARLTPEALLWTLDKRLRIVTKQLGLLSALDH